jgi:hypothetical protein
MKRRRSCHHNPQVPAPAFSSTARPKEPQAPGKSNRANGWRLEGEARHLLKEELPPPFFHLPRQGTPSFREIQASQREQLEVGASACLDKKDFLERSRPPPRQEAPASEDFTPRFWEQL